MFKKLLVVLVALLAIGGTASAYAWWDTLTVEQNNQQLTIGAGNTLVVGVSTQDTNARLVPDGAVMKANDVTEIVFTYSVSLATASEDPTVVNLTLDNLTVGTDSEFVLAGSLLNIDYASSVTIPADDSVDVTVTIWLTDDAQGNNYDTLMNKNITFDLEFDATTTTTP